MSLYISPYDSDAGLYQDADTVLEYVDRPTVSRLRHIVEEHEGPPWIVEQLSHGQFISVGGANLADDETLLAIGEGDQILHLDTAAGRADAQFVAQQTVDGVLDGRDSQALRADIAATLWNTEEIDIVWFSVSPTVSLNTAFTTFEETLDLGRGPEFLERFQPFPPTTLIPCPTDLIDDIGGPEDLLDHLGGWPVAGGDASELERFILRSDDARMGDEPTQHRYPADIPGSRQLLDAANRAQVIFLENDQFSATAYIGETEEEPDEGDTTSVTSLYGYEEFPAVPLTDIQDSLSVQFPSKYDILPVTGEDFRTILQASEPPALGPDYNTVGDASMDIRQRLKEAGREDWLRQQTGDAVLAGWTEALDQVSDGAAIPWEEAADLQQLIDLYEEIKFSLETLAYELEAGSLAELSAAETLYVALIRDLQRRTGLDENFTGDRFQILRQERYSTEFPSEISREQAPVQYIDPPGPPEDADTIERQLWKRKQLIFYGPPGTGKTYTAQRFASWWVAQQDAVRATTDQVRTVTFHPSYSYEDFVEGLTAKTNPEGQVRYKIEPGIFRSISEDAARAYREAPSPGKAPRYVLIIDEINRGQLPQIFGELITLLEADKRSSAANETTVQLSHSGARFTVPPNLYLIGTMNTADRSIALIDAAIRRRFRFLSFMPNYELILDEYGLDPNLESALESLGPDTDIDTALQLLSVGAIRAINRRILSAPDMEKGQQIGHTYLMNLQHAEEVVDAWQYEILPLIEEHYYSQFDRIREELFLGAGGQLIDWDTEQITSFTETQLITELVEIIGDETTQNLQDISGRTED